jgi:hypothetical protein
MVKSPLFYNLYSVKQCHARTCGSKKPLKALCILFPEGDSDYMEIMYVIFYSEEEHKTGNAVW